MEKLMYVAVLPEPELADLRDRLHAQVLPALRAMQGVRSVMLGIADEHVAAAAGKRLATSLPAADAVLSLWVDTVADKAGWEAELKACGGTWHGYLVTESEPLRDDMTPQPDGRVPGMLQTVLLQRPPRLSESQWLAVWQGSHTAVALRTQSTFAYRQNVVVRALTESAPPVNAIVEESFPAQAMTSDHAFYDAGADDGLLQQRVSEMMESCARFIDFDSISVAPLTEYRV